MSDELPTQNRFAVFRRYYRSLQPVIEQPRTRTYTAIIFSFLAISLFSWYAIKPTLQTILMLRREIADKTEINAKMETKIANLIEAQSNYEAVAMELPLITEAIPNNPDAVDVVLQLRNLIGSTTATASATRVGEVPLIATANPKEAASNNAKVKSSDFAVNTTLNGGYTGLESVLTLLNSLRRITTVEAISITPESEQSSTPGRIGNLLKLTLQLKSYYLP